MPDSSSGTQSAGSYRGGVWPAQPVEPALPAPAAPAAAPVAKAKPKPRAKPKAKAKAVVSARKKALVSVSTSETTAKGSESPEILAMDDARVIDTEVLAKGATGNVGSTITEKEMAAALIQKQDDRIWMGRVEDGEGLPRHRAEDGPEPEAGESVLVPPERGPQV